MGKGEHMGKVERTIETAGKKSTRCMNCGKCVSHKATDPAYELCYSCRQEYDVDGFDVQLSYMMTRKN